MISDQESKKLMDEFEQNILKIDLNKKFASDVKNDSLDKYFDLQGANLYERTKEFQDWTNELKQSQLWNTERAYYNQTGPECFVKDEYGNERKGINFASKDYLALSQEQQTKQGMIDTAAVAGIGSGGAPLAFGQTKKYLEIESKIQDFFHMKTCVLFSYGWLAFYGAVKALVRQNDHVVFDNYIHNAFKEAAQAATRKIHIVPHLDVSAYIKKIKEIRQKFKQDAILVIVEGLCSMTSNMISFRELNQVCKENQALLMVDVSNDLGTIGLDGRGSFEEQQVNFSDNDNLVFIGDGGKALCSNFGFIVGNNNYLKYYFQVFSPTFMFVNSMSPLQAGLAVKTLELINSPESQQKRKQIKVLSQYVRDKIQQRGYKVLGNTLSPIIPIFVGNEYVMKICARLMQGEGVFINSYEYPEVEKGQARIIATIIPSHNQKHLDILVNCFDRCVTRAEQIIRKRVKPELLKNVNISAKNFIANAKL